jgi:hypothetical protein
VFEGGTSVGVDVGGEGCGVWRVGALVLYTRLDAVGVMEWLRVKVPEETFERLPADAAANWRGRALRR